MGERPSSGSPAGPSGPTARHALIAVVVTTLVVVATVSFYAVSEPPQPTTSQYPVAPHGWATFRTAWAGVATAFDGLAPGPWTIVFAEGLATDAPWSPPTSLPNAFLDPACGAQLSGVSTLTFWNASAYPASNSSSVYSSGAAPLWTFVFSGADTPTFVASWVAGQVVVNAALGPTSPCMTSGEFVGTPSMDVQPSVDVDSNAIAAAVIAASQPGLPGASFPVPTPPSPSFAAYFPGPVFLPEGGVNPGRWPVVYGECGMAGQFGSNFTIAYYSFNSVSAQGGLNMWSYGYPCFDTEYVVTENATVLGTPPSPNGTYLEWSLNWTFLTSAVPPIWTASELTTSLFRWAIGPPGVALFPGYQDSGALCNQTTPVIEDCTPPPHGWYVVLLDRNGTWLDSYPTIANGTSWSISGVPLAPGDRILFVGSAGNQNGNGLWIPSGGEPAVFLVHRGFF